MQEFSIRTEVRGRVSCLGRNRLRDPDIKGHPVEYRKLDRYYELVVLYTPVMIPEWGFEDDTAGKHCWFDDMIFASLVS